MRTPPDTAGPVGAPQLPASRGRRRSCSAALGVGAAPGPARPPAIGRPGALACKIASQKAHAHSGRTTQITLNEAGTYSRTSVR
jgi:hypothetical protein